MFRFNSSITRLIGVFLLSAYCLLLCEEIFHEHHEGYGQVAATINDGTAHIAHGIIPDSPKECPICQSVLSQIHTAAFRIGPATISFAAEHSLRSLNPTRARLYSFSLRAPPASV